MKTKNKKLFALLMLPAVIAMMVLPLCSFTTVSDDVNSPLLFTSALHSSVGYIYHRTTSTLDIEYYGEIPDFNRTLISGSYDDDDSLVGLDSSTIQMYASDYIVAGNTSINYRTRSASLYPSQYYITSSLDVMGADVSLYSEDASIAYFSGDFDFSGLILPNDSSKNGLESTAVRLISSVHGAPLTPLDLSCDIYIKYALEYDGQIIYNEAYTRCQVANVSDVLDGDFISFNNILKHCFEEEPFYNDSDYFESISTPVYQFISDVNFDFIVYDSGVDSQFISGITLRDVLYNVDALNYRVYTIEDFVADYYYDLGLEAGFDNGYEGGLQQGFDVGYDSGYNAGLSDISGVWGNLGDFLTGSVGGFLDFELWDGFSIRAILVIFVSAMLLIGFLKIFAGG